MAIQPPTPIPVPKLPAATLPLSGGEIVYVVQGGQDRQTQSQNLGAGGSSGSLPLGMKSLPLSAVFDDVVAQATMLANYQFGAAAVDGGDGINIAITNMTDLAAHFNPFEDFTELVTINSEIQRYQPFNTSNHQFQSDRLNLCAQNPNGDWNALVTQIAGTVNLNNTSSTIAALGLATTAGLQLGQLVGVQGRGIYVITAIVTNTSVTLLQIAGSQTTAATSALIAWLPVQSALLTSNYTANVGTTLNFAAVPSGVLGMQMALYDSVAGFTIERNNDYRIAAVSATTVDLNVPWSLSNLTIGERIIFLPVVTSGQIWSQLQVPLDHPQVFFAIEFSVDSLPLAAQPNSTQAVTTLAAFNALPNTVPWGGWPTGWLYEAEDGSSSSETRTIAELDVAEPMISESQGCQSMNNGNFGGLISGTQPAQTTFAKTDSGWAFNTGFGITSKTDGTDFTGDHKWQLIYTNGRTYRFWDGLLFNVKLFNWGGQAPAQFALNLATGSLNAAFSANMLYPNNTNNFTGMVIGVKSIKVWYEPPP